ncbi:Embryonic polyadenylate-binding protein 2 [Aix galericulata]|nr:Embryonic polyadenylate-binding protein 2 [Aix galericulata]
MLLSPSRARAGQHDVPGALLTPSPRRYAYIEFEEKSSVKAAVELDESLFRGRVIKVLPKRTNMPGISSTDRGGYRGHFQARGGLGQRGGFYGGQQARLRGRMYR